MPNDPILHMLGLARKAGRLADNLHRNLLRPPSALVEDRERVAQCAIRNAGDEQRRVVRKLHPLLPGHIFQPRGNILRRNAAEIEALAAGKDRRGELMHLRSGEDEQHIGGRLLQRFQQRVKCADGKHMHLIDDIHTVFCRDGGKIRLLAQVANVINAVVARRVDLNYV